MRGETQISSDALPKVILTNNETGKVSSFTTSKDAGRYLGLSGGDSLKARIVNKAGDKYQVHFTETEESEQVVDLKKTFIKKR